MVEILPAPCNAFQQFSSCSGTLLHPKLQRKCFQYYLASTINCFSLLLLVLFCRCILSTDMARHNEILNKFKDILADGFSFENEVHKSVVWYSSVPCLMRAKISIIFKKSFRTELKFISQYITYVAKGYVEY